MAIHACCIQRLTLKRSAETLKLPKSGEHKCVTLRPAQDAGDLRTVLLIDEFGDAPDNPPLSVKVVGELLSDGSPAINFKGTKSRCYAPR